MKNKKESIIYLVLALVARYLVKTLRPFSIFYTVLRIALSRRYGWSHLRQYFENIAVTEDQSGNVYCAFPLNDTMTIKSSWSLFGDPDETISSVIGKNYKSYKLTKFGKFWRLFLDTIDSNHSIKAIEDDEGEKSVG